MVGVFCQEHSMEGLKQHKILYSGATITRTWYKKKCDFCDKDAEWVIS